MGCCNCGFLAQEISHLRKEEIHARALQRSGDWTEQLNDYCPQSGIQMDDLISEMLSFGFDRCDLKNLERLSDPAILKSISAPVKHLKHNVKKDVLVYLYAWAEMIEAKLLDEVRSGSLEMENPLVLG